MHFGVESPFQAHRLVWYSKMQTSFNTSPSIRKIPNFCLEIEALDMEMVVSRAKKVLRKESEEEGVRTPSTIPHFEVDLHVDGLEIFQNSEKPGMIAILGRVHSIAPSFASTVQPTVLDFSNPFIIGFEHGQVKASAKELMKLTIDEFKRLCPHNLEAEGREFTASLR
ncbi:Uncharacterized protein APZ42_005720, partial [Daphnia magna]